MNVGDIVKVIGGNYRITVPGCYGRILRIHDRYTCKVDFSMSRHLLTNDTNGIVFDVSISHLVPYTLPTKEERLLQKIKYLYKRCPTTAHWSNDETR